MMRQIYNERYKIIAYVNHYFLGNNVPEISNFKNLSELMTSPQIYSSFYGH